MKIPVMGKFPPAAAASLGGGTSTLPPTMEMPKPCPCTRCISTHLSVPHCCELNPLDVSSSKRLPTSLTSLRGGGGGGGGTAAATASVVDKGERMFGGACLGDGSAEEEIEEEADFEGLGGGGGGVEDCWSNVVVVTC